MLDALRSGRAQLKRKTWTFERLEDRCLLSATSALRGSIPVGPGSFSGTLTPEQVSMGELWWAFKQAGNLNQYTPEQLAGTTQWGVWTVDPTSGNGAGAAFNPYVGGSTISILDAGSMVAQDVIAQLQSTDNVVAFYPLVTYTAIASVASPLDEPLFESQWHLRSIAQQIGNPDFQKIFAVPGEDIRAVGAWNQGYSGKGVQVAVVDTGIQFTHPDLAGNYRGDLSFDFYQNDTNPSPTGSVGSAHGTAVAGIIGADGDNNYGMSGIAPNVDLVGLRIGTGTGGALEFAGSDANIARILTYRNDVIDVYNHSWGEGTPGRAIVPLGPLTVAALRQSILFGRPDPVTGAPLGNIHVFASGNDAGHDFPPAFPGSGNWDSTQYSGLASSRYTIAVGGVDHGGNYTNPEDGTVTNYPEAGASVLVVAPTGSVSLNIGLDQGIGSGIWTTDLMGNNGYNSPGSADGDFLEDVNFTSRFNGTSAAAPMVSGVIALMLEANPSLSYRDVQEILVRSARQNDPLDESWQVNFMEFWQDPDEVFVLVDPEDPENLDLKLIPSENPFIRMEQSGGLRDISAGGFVPIDGYAVHNLPRFTNGAGYTVSEARGYYSELYGYAHGVVDADLAVKLAKQWTTKGQHLAPELTYTTFVRPGNFNIRAAAFVGPNNAYVIPGKLGGAEQQNFHAYYAQYFEDEPFDGDDPPVNDNGIAVPLSLFEGFNLPLMKVEWVEVKVQINGGLDMNHLRIAIRSPDGTASDLNQVNQSHLSANVNNLDQSLRLGGITSPGETPFVYTFSTNRHWGERSDDFYEIDAATGQFLLDPDPGTPIFRSWDLIIENYSGGIGTLGAFEVIFHGTPITGERIQGKVGLDLWGANSSLPPDNNFNFSRTIDQDFFDETTGFVTFDPVTGQLGDGIPDDLNRDGIPDWRYVDPNQEPFVGNVTLRARDVNGSIVAQFVTGADGNYFFDLAPGTYTIEIVDPLGRTPKQDPGLNPRFQSTWTVTVDPSDLFTRVAGREVPVDDDGDGVQDFEDLDGNGIRGPDEPLIFRHQYYNDVNFLLDAGPQPQPEVDVSGFIFSDVNGDGVYNNTDTVAQGFFVYADTNRSGAFEQTEPNATTRADGTYSFTIPGVNDAQNIVITAVPLPNGWQPTNPVTAKHTIFRGPGESATDVNFGFLPPPNSDPNNPPGDEGDPGTIVGYVFSDRNGNGVQNTSEAGVPGVRVYVDVNGDGQFNYTDANSNSQYDLGEEDEPTALTNQFGGYFLAEIEPTTVQVSIIVPEDWTLTSPVGGFHLVAVPDGGQVNNIRFGIRNLATRDFGDLLGLGGTDTYRTRLAADGARHDIIPGFRLGSTVDGEVNGQPTAGANGDDNNVDDEDGVVLRGALANPTGVLVPGVVNVVDVTVFGVGGYLNAWMDFNRNGTFDPGEHIIVDMDLNPGMNAVTFPVPANLAAGPIPARFRWGTAGLDYFGPAVIGEVEDYLLANSLAPAVVVAIPGDYDGSGQVDASDYNLWKSTFGSISNLAADGNGNGVVDSADYTIWRNNVGQTSAAGGGSTANAGATASVARVLQQSRPNSRPSDEYIAQMLALGATLVTHDLGAMGTQYLFAFNTSAAGQGADAAQATLGAAPSSDPTTSDSALFHRNLVGLPFATTASPHHDLFGTQTSSTNGTRASSGTDLLLLDDVLSSFNVDRRDDESVDRLPVRDTESEQGDLELALAAAFEDESNWWHRC